MKVRMEFSIEEEGRFIGHLDLSRNFERLLRRAGLPLAFSQGFNPKPKLSFGSALAVGISSDAEYLDVSLQELPEGLDWLERLNHFAPRAFRLKRLARLDPGVKSLMAVINRADYSLELELEQPIEQPALQEALASLLAKESLPLIRFHADSRKQKEIDVRPGLFQLQGQVDGTRLQLFTRLRTGQEGNIKAQEPVLALVAESLLDVKKITHIHRNALWIAQDGELVEPMALPGVHLI